jgi:hypothetical protein
MSDERITSSSPQATNSPVGKDALAVAWNSMTAKQKIIGAGIMCLVPLALYIPWTYTFSGADGIHSEKPAGYHFIFDPPQPEKDNLRFGVKIDVPRVVIPMAVVVCVTVAGFMLAGAKTRKEGEPLA